MTKTFEISGFEDDDEVIKTAEARTVSWGAVTINRQVNWLDVLKALEVPVESRSLPSKITCPLCAYKSLTIYPDGLDGQWYHCTHCNSAGDMIELAARSWKLSTTVTLLKLHKLGQSVSEHLLQKDVLNEYQACHCDRRIQLNDFWNRVSSYAQVNSSEISELLVRLSLSVPQRDPDRWAAGPGLLFGATAQPDAAQTCQSGTTRDKYFTRGRWKDLIVFPYHSLPGKVSGFLFVGRDADRQKDFVFYPISSDAIAKRGSIREFGLYGLPTVWNGLRSWGDYVLAVDDPVAAVKLQFRHFLSNTKPLPIISWADQENIRTGSAWQAVQGKQILMRAGSLTPQLVRQAQLSNSRIIFKNRNIDRQRRNSGYRVQDSVSAWIEESKPWQEAIAKELAVASNNQIEELFLRLDLENLDGSEILRACTKEIRDRVDYLCSSSISTKPTVQLNGFRIYEQNRAWLAKDLRYPSRDPALVSDAVLRVDSVMSVSGSQEAFYSGRVLYQEHCLPFRVPVKLLATRPAKWISSFVLQQTGLLPKFTKKYEKYLLQIALDSSPPTHTHADVRVGWSEQRSSFLLPSIEITDKGATPHNNLILPLKHTPAVRIKGIEPLKFSDQEHGSNWMRPLEHNQVGWSVLTLILANVLSPLWQRKTAGIGLVGVGAWRVGRFVAEACGLIPVESRYQKLEYLRKLERRHNWPCYVPDVITNDAKVWIDHHTEMYRNCVVPVSEWQATALKITGRWRFVESHTQLELSPWLVHEAHKILPAYLQRVKQNKAAVGSRRTLVTTLITDLSEWISESGGDPDAVTAAANFIWNNDSLRLPGIAVLELLSLAAINGWMEVRDCSFLRGSGPVKAIVFDTPERVGLFVPKSTMAYIYKAHSLGQFNPAAITRALAAAEHLVDEGSIGSTHGWMINLMAWRRHLATVRSKNESKQQSKQPSFLRGNTDA